MHLGILENVAQVIFNLSFRYIEIFKSSLQEIRSAMGMGPMRMRTMGSNRMSPYDRMDRPGAFGRGGRGGYFNKSFRITFYIRYKCK